MKPICLAHSITRIIAHSSIPKFEYCVPRLFAGDILLTPAGNTSEESLRLDLWNAEARGESIHGTTASPMAEPAQPPLSGSEKYGCQRRFNRLSLAARLSRRWGWLKTVVLAD